MPIFEITVKGYMPRTCEVTMTVQADTLEGAKITALAEAIYTVDAAHPEFAWTNASADILWEEAEEAEFDEEVA